VRLGLVTSRLHVNPRTLRCEHHANCFLCQRDEGFRFGECRLGNICAMHERRHVLPTSAGPCLRGRRGELASLNNHLDFFAFPHAPRVGQALGVSFRKPHFEQSFVVFHCPFKAWHSTAGFETWTAMADLGEARDPRISSGLEPLTFLSHASCETPFAVALDFHVGPRPSFFALSSA